MIPFAILIPTRNRPEFVQRAVRWHRSQSDARIIIADSSDPRHELTLMQWAGLRQIRTPGLNELEASAVAIKVITEQFTMFIGDDDLVFHSAIARAVAIMNISDYLSAYGQAIRFELHGGMIPYGRIEYAMPTLDLVFRVYQTSVLTEALISARNLRFEEREPCFIRTVERHHCYHNGIHGHDPGLFLLRQFHDGRTHVAKSRPSIRQRLGHAIPPLTRINQWMRAKLDPDEITAASMRHKTSPYYKDWREAEHFLSRGKDE